MARTEPTIAHYVARTADEIAQRLRTLSQADLAKLDTYERQGQGRSTVLERIAALRGETPWPGYDDMEVEEVNDALQKRDGDAADRVLDYERQHKARATVIDFAKRRQAAGNGSSGGRRSTGRAASSRSGSGAKRSASGGTSARRTSARKASSASSRSRSAAASGSRSTGGGAGKTSASRKRTASSSRAKASGSGSRGSGSSSRAGRSRSSSVGAGRARTQRTPQTMPARVKQRVTEALHSGEAWTEKVAKDAGHTVGSAAQNAGQAAQDAGQAVGTTANKVKGPALKGVAVAAALGGGIALGRGLNARLRKGRRVLGVPVPRKPAVGNAADRVGHAVDRLGSTGHQIGQWSDDIQYLRGRIAGKPPMDMPVDGESPLVKLAEGKGVRRLVIRTVAKRVLS